MVSFKICFCQSLVAMAALIENFLAEIILINKSGALRMMGYCSIFRVLWNADYAIVQYLRRIVYNSFDSCRNVVTDVCVLLTLMWLVTVYVLVYVL